MGASGRAALRARRRITRPVAARRLTRWLAGACLLLALAACTGTSSLQAPRLLAIVHEPTAGTNVIALVSDADGGGGPRFTYLDASERSLPAGTAVALDVVDRGGIRSEVGARSQLALLMRTAPGGYELLWFNTEAVAADDPVAFAEVARLDVTQALVDAGVDQEDLDELCLTSMQVSGAGDMVALLNSPRACTATSLLTPIIYVLDRDGDNLRTFGGAESMFVEAPVLIDQRDDTLYYLEEWVGLARLHAVDLTTGSAEDPVPFASGSAESAPRDLAFGRGAALLLLQNRLHWLPLPPAGGAPGSNAENGAVRVVDDPYLDMLEFIVVLRGSQLAVHTVLDGGTAPQGVNLGSGAVRDAVIDPERLWGYLLRDGRLTVIDLLPATREEAPNVTQYPLTDDLGQGALITWIPGVLPDPGVP